MERLEYRIKLLRAWSQAVAHGLASGDIWQLPEEKRKPRRSELYYVSRRQLKLQLEAELIGIYRVGVVWDNGIPKIAMKWPPKNSESLDYLTELVLNTIWSVLNISMSRAEEMEFRMMVDDFWPSELYTSVVAVWVKGRPTVYIQARNRRVAQRRFGVNKEFDEVALRSKISGTLTQPASGKPPSL